VVTEHSSALYATFKRAYNQLILQHNYYYRKGEYVRLRMPDVRKAEPRVSCVFLHRTDIVTLPIRERQPIKFCSGIRMSILSSILWPRISLIF